MDELPQSAAGRTIMTTEPKFIPEEAVEVAHGRKRRFLKVRLIDCVGYIVPSALGYLEDEHAPDGDAPPGLTRKSPSTWRPRSEPKRSSHEHSTIGLVITTDGSISDIPREEYEEAEERVIQGTAGDPQALYRACSTA